MATRDENGRASNDREVVQSLGLVEDAHVRWLEFVAQESHAGPLADGGERACDLAWTKHMIAEQVSSLGEIRAAWQAGHSWATLEQIRMECEIVRSVIDAALSKFAVSEEMRISAPPFSGISPSRRDR